MLSTLRAAMSPHRGRRTDHDMTRFALRYLAPVLIAGLAAILLAGGAFAESTRVTFLLVNDIYQMGDQEMADGKRRGGFARLAAIVKAERAKGGHVIFAHGGDTLSPSLMSGVDRGAHIVTLTNMVSLDVFVPGNHEFDFGKSIFFQRMREGADFVVAVVHADRKQGYEIMSARAVDLLLSGHNHDLFVNYDGRNAVVESSYNGIYVTAVDIDIEVKI